jgi:phosphoglycerate dehydrogenase-like enzyme
VHVTTVFCGVSQVLEQLQRALPGQEVVDLYSFDGPVPKDAVLFAGYDQRSLDAATSGVAWIQLPFTGIDGVNPILLNAPIVTCGKGAGAVPIAEYVIATLLASARNFPAFWLHEAPEVWNFQPTVSLVNQKIGLVGFGGIGQRVALLAQSFGMSVSAIRRTMVPSEVPGVEIVENLAALLPDLDHLVLCAPSTPLTRNILNDETFSLVKPGLHVVNIARGSLIDQEALRRALDNGRVARASLDVCVPEPLPSGHWLYSHERVFLTPHASWTGVPFLSGAVELFVVNLRRYAQGEPLVGVVDLSRGY